MRKCILWSIIRKDDVFHHQYVIMWIQVEKSLQYMNDVLRYKSSFHKGCNTIAYVIDNCNINVHVCECFIFNV